MGRRRRDSRLLLPGEGGVSRRDVVLGIIGLGAFGAYKINQGLNFVKLANLWEDFPVSSNIQLQSSFQGKITSIHTTQYRPKEKVDEFKAISEFFDVPVHVYTDTDFDSNTDLVTHRPISYTAHKWMRDVLLFTKDEKAVMNPFAKSPNFGKELREIANYLQNDGLEVVLSPFVFEGGQMLQIGDTTLVAELFNDPRNFPGLRLTSDPVLRQRFNVNSLYDDECEGLYRYLFGGDVGFMPTGLDINTLGGHIDMTTMPVTDRRILVGDVALAQGILDEISNERIKGYERTLHQIVQLENFKDMSEREKRNINLFDDVVNLRNGSKTRFGKMLAQECDRTAQYLERVGFSVQRIPLFASGSSYSNDAVVLTYNNVLLEQETGKVILPTYGIPELDEVAQQAFRDVGYSTQLHLDSRKDLAAKSGPHCNYNEQRERSA